MKKINYLTPFVSVCLINVESNLLVGSFNSDQKIENWTEDEGIELS